jgi:hypothetical protein
VISAAYALNADHLDGASLAEIQAEIDDDIAAYSEEQPWVDVSRFNNDLEQTLYQMGTRRTLLISTMVSFPGSSLTIPADITLQFLRGGMIEISAGQLLRIEGFVEAARLQQIFTGGCDSDCSPPPAGAVEFVSGHIVAPEVYPHWWGAVHGPQNQEDGEDNTAAFQAAIETGKPVLVPPGLYDLYGELHGMSDQQISCAGTATTLRQINPGNAVITWTDESRFALRNCRITGNGTHALQVIARTANVLIPVFENLEIAGWGSDGAGLFLDVDADVISCPGPDPAPGECTIYYPHIRNVNFNGGTAGNRIALQVSREDKGNVVGGSVFGGRITNVKTGIAINSASGLMMYGLSLDGIVSSGDGHGILYNARANSTLAFGMRFEAIDIFAEFDGPVGCTGSIPADNLLWGMLGNATMSQVIDGGCRNHVFGADGSGGFKDRYRYPIFLNTQGCENNFEGQVCPYCDGQPENCLTFSEIP